MTDLTKLKELAERASVGDWSYSPCVADKHFLGQVWNGSGESLCIMDHMTEQANSDGEFIAAANPQAILGLIAEVERLRGTLLMVQNAMTGTLRNAHGIESLTTEAIAEIDAALEGGGR